MTKIPQFCLGDRVAFMRIAFDSNGHIGNITEIYPSRTIFLYTVKDDAGTEWWAVPETSLVRITDTETREREALLDEITRLNEEDYHVD